MDPKPIAAGEIFWAEDPNATGSEQQKLRPYVIMSRRSLNDNNTIVGVPLSTKTVKAEKYPAFCILVPKGEIVVDIGEMPASDCAALCHQVRVLDKSRLRKHYAKLSLTATAAVQAGLGFVFNI